MKLRPKLLWFAVSGLCLAGFQPLTAAAQSVEPAPATDPRPQWVVSVNGQKVSVETFNLFFGERLRQIQTPPTPQLQNEVIGDLVNLLLIAEDARRRGLDKQPQVQSALKLQEDQILTRFAVQTLARDFKPSDEALKKAFDAQYANRPVTEYKTRHVLVSSEDEAKAIIQKLEGGAKFDELSKETQDPTGDDLGWINPADVVAPFAEALKPMKPGTHSKTPVKTDFGWHVILLEETREGKAPTLDEVKAELVAALKQQAVTDYLTQLRDKAEIELNPALTKAPETAPPAGDAKPAETK